MEKSLGKELAVRHTRGKTIFKIRFGGFIVLVAAVATTLAWLTDIVGDTVGSVEGLVGLGLVPIALLFIIMSKWLFHHTAILYEEGIVTKVRGGEHRFHFSEINGLRENDSRDSVIVTGGGLVGDLLSGVNPSELDYSTIPPGNKGVQIRRVDIEPASGGDQETINVVSTAGHDLADLYTVWFIKTNNITKENVNSHTISFGKELSFKQGMFIHTHPRNGKILGEVAAKDVASVTLKERDDGKLKFNALNERGKEKSVISIEHVEVLNFDLVFYIHSITKL